MDVSGRLDELLTLPENWDAYGAKRIAPRAVDGMKKLFADLTKLANDPHVSPLCDGGVAIERGDIEIEIDAEGGLSLLWCEDSFDQETWQVFVCKGR